MCYHMIIKIKQNILTNQGSKYLNKQFIYMLLNNLLNKILKNN